MQFLYRTVLGWIGLLLFLSQSVWATPDPTKVTLQLNWLHQFEFAGYYAAVHKGFYKEVGLDVTLKEGSPSLSSIDEVTQGRADFGVSSSGLVKSFLEGKPVFVLAPVFQHSPEVLLTLKPNLTSPSDVARAGALGLQPGDESLDLKAMFVNEGIPLNKLDINTQANGLQDLIAGKVVATNAFLSNEPFTLTQRGIPFHVIDPRQYGMDFYNGVLFTSRAMNKAQPKAVSDFRRASLKGWEYALAHPDEIIGLILSQYNTQAKSRDYLVFESKVLTNLIGSDMIQLGHSNPGRWRYIVETYAKFGIIKFDYSLDGFAYDPNPQPVDITWLYQLLGIVIVIGSALGGVALYISRMNRKLQLANQAINLHVAEQHQFMDMLTHELKTPIAVATLSVNQIVGQEPPKRRANQALRDMSDVVDRCQQFDQLEFQGPVVQAQPCDLAALIGALCARLPDADRVTVRANALPVVQTDPQFLNIVLGNLLSNALKYSPAESPIHIEAEASTDAGRFGVSIRVQNLPNTAGFPDAEQIFKKYYRSAGAKKQTGSGLGLYLVQRFTAILEGHIHYAKVQGQVAFTVWLPCCELVGVTGASLSQK